MVEERLGLVVPLGHSKHLRVRQGREGRAGGVEQRVGTRGCAPAVQAVCYSAAAGLPGR